MTMVQYKICYSLQQIHYLSHFYLLVTEAQEGGISKFMQTLGTAYAMYNNQKYERTGGLFEGKLKAQHVDFD